MNWLRNAAIAMVCLGAVLASETLGEAQSTAAKPLIVGTKQAPPFAIKNADGTWSGISIDLWRAIANELQLKYELHEFDLDELLESVEKGSVDAAVAALTVTGEREKVMDFTHPFYSSGLGIAVARNKGGNWFGTARRIFSGQLVQIVLALAVLLFIVGVLVWLIERRKNPQQFERGVSGVWSGFWWAAVTMTTVGYGDKAPVTVAGRIVALLWMFTAIIALTAFMAAFTAAITISELESPLQGLEGLARARVGTLADSSTVKYLQAERIGYLPYSTLRDALRAVAAGEIDAVVHDKPLLRYLVATEMPNVLEVLPQTLDTQSYGIGLPSGSLLREPINQIILEKTQGKAWKDLLFRYLSN